MAHPQQHVGLLVVGAGPAGYTAAIYAARSGIDTVLVTGDQPGGQLTLTTDVENYPGFAAAVQGPWLMEQMHNQCLGVGVKIAEDCVERVDFSVSPFVCVASQTVYHAQSVVVATGAKAKWLGLESEALFRGYGVSSCATCDGFFFKDQHVVVVGGGNTAAEEALFLANHAKKITVIHRRSRLRADHVLQDRLNAHPKITFLWDHVVDEVLGKTIPHPVVTGVRVRHVKTGQEGTLDAQGVFVAIGHSPNTAFLRNALALDEKGYVQGKQPTHTSVPGVFAAGDVQDQVYRQAITAAGQGCMAALEARSFLLYS